MNSLSIKEQNNYQFDFLKSNHSLFGYFTRLVDQYTKILMPKNIETILKACINDKFHVKLIFYNYNLRH